MAESGAKPDRTSRKPLTGKKLEDALILTMLVEAEESYRDGDRKQLLNVIYLCAKYQAVIPDWAADEFLSIKQALRRGEFVGPNEAFGWTTTDVKRANTRRRVARLATIEAGVVAALMHHRVAGGDLSAGGDEVAGRGLDEVAKSLGVARSDVIAIYKKHRDAIRGISKGDSSQGHAVAIMEWPTPPRRHGRGILRDTVRNPRQPGN